VKAPSSWFNLPSIPSLRPSALVRQQAAQNRTEQEENKLKEELE